MYNFVFQNITNSHRMDAIESKFIQAQQGHVFNFWNELSQSERDRLISQLLSFDPFKINDAYESASNLPIKSTVNSIEPVDQIYDATKVPIEKLKSYGAVGLKAIRAGQVAILVLAGGQGTRLGTLSPKGCYNIINDKSLFELQAERLLEIQTLAGPFSVIPWYIMTSPATHDDTVAFFKKHSYFGISPDNVKFFKQGVLPALTTHGKIIMETKGSVAMAPEGNGGMYKAIGDHCIDDMRDRGIKYVHVYCVDNCLVKIADPVFMGFSVHSGVQVGIKTVTKNNPDEPVGIFCLKNGKLDLLEYSEIDSSVASKKNDDDSGLAFDSANIANFFYTVDFLETCRRFVQLPYHMAIKKVTCIDTLTGETIIPTEPNAIKLELFNTDVLPYCKKYSLFNCHRYEEFSPLKNKEGADSPESCRLVLADMFPDLATGLSV